MAIRYGRELRHLIQRLARRRGDEVDFSQLHSGENTEIKRQVKTEMEKNRDKTQKTPLVTKLRGKGATDD